MLRLGGWLAVSVGLHAVATAALLVGVIPVEWAAEVQPEPVSIEILPLPVEPEPALRELTPEPEPEAAIPEPSPSVAAVEVPNPRPRPPDSREVDPRVTTNEPGPSTVSLIEPPTVSDVPPRPVDPDEERRRMQALLDPTSVARGGFDFGGPGPSQRGPPAGLGPLERRPSEREIEQRLASGLRAEALTKNHTARAPFVLRRRPDGSQAWEGPRLTGVVLPDGSVRFDDRPNVQTNGFSASGTFDATEAIMGASGQDPLRGERDYFMRNTEELRGRLEAQHRRAEMDRGLRGLRGRLAATWAREDRTAAARRRRIFSLWDDADEDDEGGRRARALIIEFVREVVPQGSEHAFTEEELRRWNAARASRDAFSPY